MKLVVLILSLALKTTVLAAPVAKLKARKKFAEAEKERANWEHIGLSTEFNVNHAT